MRRNVCCSYSVLREFLKKNARREVWGGYFFWLVLLRWTFAAFCLQYGEIKQSHFRGLDRGCHPAPLRNGAGLPPRACQSRMRRRKAGPSTGADRWDGTPYHLLLYFLFRSFLDDKKKKLFAVRW
ncbi:UNVERIFIED_CONTAM: hypothetical protein K2H54_013201 [Gekko kuhli]